MLGLVRGTAVAMASDKFCNKHLIELGADVNAAEFNGKIALHSAVMAHNDQAVADLLAAGADPNQAMAG